MIGESPITASDFSHIVYGFLGSAEAKETPRQVVPLIRINEHNILIDDESGDTISQLEYVSLQQRGLVTSLNQPLAYVKGNILLLWPPKTTDIDAPYESYIAILEVVLGTVTTKMRFMYAPQMVIDQALNDLSHESFISSLYHFEKHDMQRATSEITKVLAAGGRRRAALSVLWAIKTMQRIGLENSFYVEAIQDELARGTNEGTVSLELTQALLTRGYTLESRRTVDVVHGITADEAYKRSREGFAYDWKGRVPTSLWLLWDHIVTVYRDAERRRDQDVLLSTSNAARNYCYILSTLTDKSKIYIALSWLNTCRLLSWKYARTARQRGSRHVARNFFLASMHIATYFIDLKKDEPTNYFHRARCFEALGANYREQMKADAQYAIELTPSAVYMEKSSDYQYVYATGMADCCRLLGNLSLAEGEWGNAETHFRNATKKFEPWLSNDAARSFVHPRHARCLYELGRLNANSKYIGQARDLLEQLSPPKKSDGTRDPVLRRNFGHGWLELGDCYRELADYAMAEEYYTIYIELRPHEYTGKDRLRGLYLRIRNVDDEKKMIVSLQSMASNRDDKPARERADNLMEGLNRFLKQETVFEQSFDLERMYVNATEIKDPIKANREMIRVESIDPLYAELEPSFVE